MRAKNIIHIAAVAIAIFSVFLIIAHLNAKMSGQKFDEISVASQITGGVVGVDTHKSAINDSETADVSSELAENNNNTGTNIHNTPINNEVRDNTAPETEDPASGDPSKETQDFTVTGGNRKNVIVITLDTLRADHVSFLGYDRETTPFLDGFSESAAIFENAHCAIPLTTPSHTTIFSGTYPIEHKIISNSGQTTKPLLAEMLKKAGYLTAAFVSAKPTEPLNKGFDMFDFSTAKISNEQNDDENFTQDTTARTSFRRQGNQTLAEFKDWIQKEEITKPTFIWLHFYDVHSPYISEYKKQFGAEIEYNDSISCLKQITTPTKNNSDKNKYPPSYCEEQLLKLYDGGVYTVDIYVKQALEMMQEKGLLENAIIIITADHGENLGERWDYFHGKDVYNPTTRVPLLIKIPGLKQEKIAQDISLVSITPTILDYLDINFSLQFDGPSLLPLLEGKKVNTPSIIESGGAALFAPGMQLNYVPISQIMDIARDTDRTVNCTNQISICRSELLAQKRTAIVYNNKKLIDNKGTTLEFYDLEKDPQEKHNIYGISDSSEYEKLLNSWINVYEKNPVTEEEQQLDNETLESLKSLGYID